VKAPHADPTVANFIARRSAQCAYRVFTARQVIWYFLLASVLVLFFLYDWLYALTTINLIAAGFYFSVISYKCIVVLLAVFRRREIVVTPEQLATLSDDDLPLYTILVPLYREPHVASKIISYINAFDYPPEKLDVKLLLEENDEATIAACRGVYLPECYEIIVVPHSLPKTKPKACNHGLLAARGEFLVIYDAEDRPEPDQLKKAVYAFRGEPENVACLQAKLNYYNPYQNTLTRWFTIEYTAWFDLYLPGLHALGVPIPLGGTSNHFRTDILRKLDGWDPFNVTEDCDLGVRLHSEGYRTKVLDSTTWEEANSRVGNWIRQRSRWVKGYLQTHLVHMRNPLALFWRLGPKNFVSFLLTVGGLGAMLILNPIYWIIGLVYLSLLLTDVIAAHGPTDELAWRMLFLSPKDDPFWSGISLIFFVVTWVLVCANLLFIFINVLACHKRGYRRLIPLALLSPIYWVVISIAAWKGFIQLFTNPFYWEKTVHGLFSEPPVPETAIPIEPEVILEAPEPIFAPIVEGSREYERIADAQDPEVGKQGSQPEEHPPDPR